MKRSGHNVQKVSCRIQRLGADRFQNMRETTHRAQIQGELLSMNYHYLSSYGRSHVLMACAAIYLK